MKRIIIKNLIQKIYENCSASVEKLPDQTTNDMIEKNVKINDCLNTAINQEIQKGFNAEQQVKMRQYVEQLRKASIGFYYGIYTENKYCEGSCGTITNIIPYSDEGKMLSELPVRSSFPSSIRTKWAERTQLLKRQLPSGKEMCAILPCRWFAPCLC